MKFVLAILSHTIRTRGTILIFQGDTELLETYLTYWGNAGCRFHFRQKWEHNGVPVLREDWDRNIIWCNIPILLGSWLDRDSQGSSNYVPYVIKQPNRRGFCYLPWSALRFPFSLPGLCVAHLLCWHLVVEQQLCAGDLLSGNCRMCCL